MCFLISALLLEKSILEGLIRKHKISDWIFLKKVVCVFECSQSSNFAPFLLAVAGGRTFHVYTASVFLILTILGKKKLIFLIVKFHCL